MTMQETIARVLQDNAFKQEFSDSFGIDNLLSVITVLWMRMSLLLF